MASTWRDAWPKYQRLGVQPTRIAEIEDLRQEVSAKLGDRVQYVLWLFLLGAVSAATEKWTVEANLHLKDAFFLFVWLLLYKASHRDVV
jgi:hypothetical protein